MTDKKKVQPANPDPKTDKDDEAVDEKATETDRDETRTSGRRRFRR